MSGWDSWVDMAAALIPRERRATWSEQWRADMRDAHEVGVSRAALALSMFSLAIAGLPGHRPSGVKVGLMVVGTVAATAASILMPFLILVYLVVGLFVLAMVGRRRGVPELTYAAIGIVLSVAALASTVAALRVNPVISASVVVSSAVLVIGSGLTVASFGRAWAARNRRPLTVWLALVCSALSALAAFGFSVMFVAGIAAARSFGPGDQPPPTPDILTIIVGLLLLGIAGTALVSVIFAAASTRPTRPPTGTETSQL